jgi:hypothetical protein
MNDAVVKMARQLRPGGLFETLEVRLQEAMGNNLSREPKRLHSETRKPLRTSTSALTRQSNANRSSTWPVAASSGSSATCYSSAPRV